MPIDLERFINFINTELPKRIVLLHGSQYTGDPNLSSDPKVNNSPPGTFLMEHNTKALWQKKDTAKDTWQRAGVGGGELGEALSETLVAGDNILVDFDSATNKITITGKPISTQQIQDLIGPTLKGTDNINITYDDTNDQIVIRNERTDEDIVSLIGNVIDTDDMVSVTLDETTNTISIESSLTGDHISSLINDKLIAGDDISITYDPDTGEIKFDNIKDVFEIMSSRINELINQGENIALSEDTETGEITIGAPDLLRKNEINNFFDSSDNINLEYDPETGILTIDASDLLRKNRIIDHFKGGDDIDISYDPEIEEITIDTNGNLLKRSQLDSAFNSSDNINLIYDPETESLTIDASELLEKDRLIDYLGAGNNINLSYDEPSGIVTIENIETLNSNLIDYLSPGNNIEFEMDPTTREITINSTASGGVGAIFTKDAVFSLGGELITGPQSHTEMMLPYDAEIKTLTVNKGVSSTNSSNLIFSLDILNENTGNWDVLKTFELQVDENNVTYDVLEEIDNDIFRISLVSGDYENVSNMNVILKLESATVIEGDRDVVFMLGTSLILGPQEKTEIYVPYQKYINTIIANKGQSSSNTEDIGLFIEYYDETANGWYILDNITIPSGSNSAKKFVNIEIDNPTLRVSLFSGDVENVSNMSVMLRLSNQPRT